MVSIADDEGAFFYELRRNANWLMENVNPIEFKRHFNNLSYNPAENDMSKRIEELRTYITESEELNFKDILERYRKFAFKGIEP